jgi:hypothetical protein
MAFLHSGAMTVDVQFLVRVVEGRKEMLVSFSSLTDEYKKVEKMAANCNGAQITEAQRPLKLSGSFSNCNASKMNILLFFFPLSILSDNSPPFTMPNVSDG